MVEATTIWTFLLPLHPAYLQKMVYNITASGFAALSIQFLQIPVPQKANKIPLQISILPD